MKNNFCLQALLLFVAASLGCSGTSNGNSPNNSALNLAGVWTVTKTSSQGYGTTSATANVTQSGQGIGTNGTTTLTSVVGSIAVTQSGANLNGLLTNSIKGSSYSFTGTISGDNITITWSTPCSVNVSPSDVQTGTIQGTITSTSMQGTYTTTVSGPGAQYNCYQPNDSGTWTATK